MAVTLLFREFKENCNINNAIIDYTRKENEFSIHIYCLEEDMNTKKEKNRLLHLYYKHELSYHLCYEQPNWELPEENNNFYKTNLFLNIYF